MPRVECRDAGLRKIDNFLPSRRRHSIVFQKSAQGWLALPEGHMRPRLRRYGQGMTRKSCPKPLKSLKTDSLIRRLAVVEGDSISELRTIPNRGFTRTELWARA
jgi:hypothetical protein